MDKDSAQLRPYRATQLWNDVIRTFRAGMVRGRHRRYMKSYDDCFSASEAVDWLHGELQKNPNFGPSVTRAQTLQLLQKFQKAHVFSDIRGSKRQDAIADNGRLYRFNNTSPEKKSQTPGHIQPRPPLAPRLTGLNIDKEAGPPPQRVRLDFDKVQVEEEPLSECHLVATSRISPQEVDDVWKGTTLASLQKNLQLDSLDDILDSNFVSTQNIRHNMTQVNRNGVVNNIDKKDQLPYWVLSAMRCLARWPDKVEDNLPDYPGFEKDVFKVIKDYFEDLAEPLLTFAMYEVFANVFVCAESIGKPQLGQQHQSIQSKTVPGGITSFASVENLMMNLTMNGVPGGEDEQEELLRELPYVSNLNHAYHPARSCDPRVNGVAIGQSYTTRGSYASRYASEGNLGRWDQVEQKSSARSFGSTYSVPQQTNRLETSFSIDTNEPHTHFYQPEHTDSNGLGYRYLQSTASMLGSKQFPSALSIDSPYGTDEIYLGYEQKCLSTNDISNMAAYPENGLSSYDQVSSRRKVHSIREAEDCSYGYSVVLSTTPKYERQRAHSGSSFQRPSHDHDFFWSKSQLKQSEARLSSQPPPPYVPPPSYTSLYRLPQVNNGSDDASSSSYETAASYLSAQEEVHCAEQLAHQELAVPHTDHQAWDGLSVASRNRLTESLRICCLLLPPANRKKLHLLLRLMVKLIENTRLKVDDDTPTRPLVLQTFARCILRSAEEADYDEVLSLQIVTFIMDNYSEIMKVPDDVNIEIEERLAQLRRSKVSIEEYERRKLSTSQRALNDLLDNIVKDDAMAQKEKKRRLKQFQKSYPDIYAKRFLPSDSKADRPQKKPRIKPALLSRPLMKLKSFRI